MIIFESKNSSLFLETHKNEVKRQISRETANLNFSIEMQGFNKNNPDKLKVSVRNAERAKARIKDLNELLIKLNNK